MTSEQRNRLQWINLYNKTHDAGFVCRHFGISRPTLRKWLRRYNEHGREGLKDQSKTPFWDEIIENYDPQKERIRVQNYALDCLMFKLK